MHIFSCFGTEYTKLSFNFIIYSNRKSLRVNNYFSKFICGTWKNSRDYSIFIRCSDRLKKIIDLEKTIQIGRRFESRRQDEDLSGKKDRYKKSLIFLFIVWCPGITSINTSHILLQVHDTLCRGAAQRESEAIMVRPLSLSAHTSLPPSPRAAPQSTALLYSYNTTYCYWLFIIFRVIVISTIYQYRLASTV